MRKDYGQARGSARQQQQMNRLQHARWEPTTRVPLWPFIIAVLVWAAVFWMVL